MKIKAIYSYQMLLWGKNSNNWVCEIVGDQSSTCNAPTSGFPIQNIFQLVHDLIAENKILQSKYVLSTNIYC